jgi:hypothetical protein
MNRRILCTIIVVAGCVCWPHVGLGYDSGGKRDPFVTLIERNKEKAKYKIPSGLEGVTSIQEVLLEGIAMGPMGKNAAIMNGQMVKENDKVGIVQIKKISKKKVELLVGGKDYTVSLQDEKGIKIGKQ